MSLSTCDGRVVATLCAPSSVGHTTGIVESGCSDEDFLFRLVVYTSGKTKFLGLVEDAYIPSEKTRRRLTIRNLLSLRESGKAVPVRNAPNINSEVYFASEDDLERFLPREKFPKNGYLGHIRSTKFPLPFDLNRLCFGNAAVLAGIGHGKSHLAALVATQLYLAGKKVLVIDPSGEWNKIMEELKNKLAPVGISVSLMCFDVEAFSETDAVNAVFDYLSSGEKILAIVDVSLPTCLGGKGGPDIAEFKLSTRREFVYRIQERLMDEASMLYAKSKVSYGFQTCVVLDEAHEFVPHEEKEDVSILFSISTKEYRKFGLGHVFIDQSLKAISEDLQIQTFLLGATTTPTDLNFVDSQLGKEVASAAQRTIGGTDTPSWVAYGAATPMNGIPWEIETFQPKELSLFSKQ